MSLLPPDLTVKTWPDAIGVAFALADEFAYLHAGLLLDPSGRVAAIRLHTLEARTLSEFRESVDPHAGFDQVLRWVVRQPHTWPTDRCYREQTEPGIHADSGSVLLVSVGALQCGVPADAQRQLFLKAQHAAELSGFRLLDVIETDGDCVRSFASLFDPKSWRRLL